jgi:tetratricopeptide (TPR) repeat protein
MSRVDRYRRAREIFVQAIELAPADRARLLDADCAGDTDLRTEVDSLLAAHDTSGGFDSLGRARSPSASVPRLDVARFPERIGRYRILSVLGEGGMGVVYEAEQENPRRTIALKVLRAGLASAARSKRFEQEAQILGRLHHPGIAQVYEAGLADTGTGLQPFLAMELVEGRPLVEHANAAGLDVRACLELLVLVCQAVHHAHEHGVVHRDLKPANVLVDAQGRPKVLDFGIARATSEGLERATMLTGAGEVLGTLSYMSPEQLDERSAEIDARADVYALGVIGYELLAGRLPIDISKLSLPEAARAIREENPVPLGAAIRRLRGDVETILGKALEKERERRYASALELAQDLERWLAEKPIHARPASTMYQLAKFARRNRALVGGVAGIFVALVLGIAATAWKASEARGEARRARAEIAFIQTALASVEPDASGRDVTMLQFLDDAARSLEGAFPGEPRIEEPLQATVGVTYRNLGRIPESEAHLRRSVELARAAYGREDPATTRAESELAETLAMAEKHEEAEALARICIDRVRRGGGHAEIDEVPASIVLARTFAARGRYAEAEPFAQRNLGIRRRILGDADTRTVEAIVELALLRMQEGKAAEAVELLREGLALQSRVPKEKPSLTLAILNALAHSLQESSRPDEAREVLEKLVDRCRAIFGEDDYRTLGSEGTLAMLLAGLGRVDEGAERLARTLDLARKAPGPGSIAVLGALESMATLRGAQGRAAEAADLARERAEICAAAKGDGNEDTLDARFEWARCLLAADRASEADEVVERTVESSRKSFATGHPMRAWFDGVRRAAWISRDPSRLDEAEKLLEEAWPAIEATFGAASQRGSYALTVRLAVCRGLGRSDEADAIQRRLAGAKEREP